MKRAGYSKVNRGHIVRAVYQRNFALDDQVMVHFVSETMAAGGPRRCLLGYRRWPQCQRAVIRPPADVTG